MAHVQVKTFRTVKGATMTTEKKLWAKFKKVVKSFKFNKVHAVMATLQWTWIEAPDRVPTTSEMRTRVWELFEHLLSLWREEPHTISIASGGFKVSIFKTKRGIYEVELEFLVTSAESTYL